MQKFSLIFLSIFLLLPLTGCAEFDRKFDQALFGSDENIQAAHQKIAENKKKEELKKWEDAEEDLFDAICAARKKRWLPCDHRNWDAQGRARAAAAAMAQQCAALPNESMAYAVHPDALGTLPQDHGGRRIFICRMQSPRAVLEAWGEDKRTRTLLWDEHMRTFTVAVYRSGGGPFCWVLLEK